MSGSDGLKTLYEWDVYFFGRDQAESFATDYVQTQTPMTASEYFWTLRTLQRPEDMSMVEPERRDEFRHFYQSLTMASDPEAVRNFQTQLTAREAVLFHARDESTCGACGKIRARGSDGKVFCVSRQCGNKACVYCGRQDPSCGRDGLCVLCRMSTVAAGSCSLCEGRGAGCHRCQGGSRSEHKCSRCGRSFSSSSSPSGDLCPSCQLGELARGDASDPLGLREPSLCSLCGGDRLRPSHSSQCALCRPSKAQRKRKGGDGTLTRREHTRCNRPNCDHPHAALVMDVTHEYDSKEQAEADIQKKGGGAPRTFRVGNQMYGALVKDGELTVAEFEQAAYLNIAPVCSNVPAPLVNDRVYKDTSEAAAEFDKAWARGDLSEANVPRGELAVRLSNGDLATLTRSHLYGFQSGSVQITDGRNTAIRSKTLFQRPLLSLGSREPRSPSILYHD